LRRGEVKYFGGGGRKKKGTLHNYSILLTKRGWGRSWSQNQIVKHAGRKREKKKRERIVQPV